jgi:hypothetical protein
MPKSDISNLELKLKLTSEYLDDGGYNKIWDKDLIEDLILVKNGPDGKVDPDTISKKVNAFMLAILASQLNPPFFPLIIYQNTKLLFKNQTALTK